MCCQGCLQQCVPILRTLGNGLAEQVRIHQAPYHVVQRDHQVMGRNGGKQILESIKQLNGVLRSDVLHRDAQAWICGCEMLVHFAELSLAVHHKAMRFTVHQQGNVQVLHDAEHVVHCANVLHASFGVGCRAGRVQLDSQQMRLGCLELLFGVVAEKERHVRFERGGANSGSYLLGVPQQSLKMIHRWQEIGHDHSAGEMLGGEWGNHSQHAVLAHMEVHIQGRSERYVHVSMESVVDTVGHPS